MVQRVLIPSSIEGSNLLPSLVGNKSTEKQETSRLTKDNPFWHKVSNYNWCT